MMLEFIVRNLLHRPMRTLIGVLGIAVEVALEVLGLTSGMLLETAKRIEGIGADLMVQSPAASYLIGISSAPMPIKIGEKLRELQYVQAVAPALLQFNSSGSIETVWGIDPASFNVVSGGFVYLQGRGLEGPDDLLMDDWASKSKQIKVGDTFNILNHQWHVVGIIEHGKGARIFVPLATLQDLVGALDKASIFLVKCTRPEHTNDVLDETRQLLPGYTVRPLSAFASQMTPTNFPGLQTFIDSMVSLAVAVGLLVIFLTMYTTVLERTRDIGVLKALGAGRVFIVRALLSESAGLCFLGIAAGIGLSYAARAAFLASFPTLSIDITAEWIVRAALIALLGATLGASYPAWVASRKDAVEALSYD
jgi:putative ABC transport system permease protein